MSATRSNNLNCFKFFHYFGWRIVLVAFLSGMPVIVSGQSYNHRHRSRNELAFIPGVVFDLGDDYYSYLFHGLYLRSFDELSSRISVGLSIEYVSGDEIHLTTGPVVAIHPADPLVLMYSPGITKKNSGTTVYYFFSSHFEIALELGLGEHLHFGPSAGFSLSGYDIHFSVGLYTGFAF